MFFLFFYCFLYTCKHSNSIFPQNCPIRATSLIRSLTTLVSFRSFSSKILSRSPNNGSITDSLWVAFKENYFYQWLLGSSWWCVELCSVKELVLENTCRCYLNMLLELIKKILRSTRYNMKINQTGLGWCTSISS